jgi:hypothetical protein
MPSELRVDVGQALGKGHEDAFGGEVEGEEVGLDVGDEDFISSGGEDGEERGGFFEAASAVRGGGEMDVGYDADEGGWVWG